VASPLAATVLARKGVSDAEEYYRSLPWGRALSLDEVAAVVVECRRRVNAGSVPLLMILMVRGSGAVEYADSE
jgi:hypothetical protein